MAGILLWDLLQRSSVEISRRHFVQIALQRDFSQQLLQRTCQGDLAHDLPVIFTAISSSRDHLEWTQCFKILCTLHFRILIAHCLEFLAGRIDGFFCAQRPKGQRFLDSDNSPVGFLRPCNHDWWEGVAQRFCITNRLDGCLELRYLWAATPAYFPRRSSTVCQGHLAFQRSDSKRPRTQSNVNNASTPTYDAPSLIVGKKKRTNYILLQKMVPAHGPPACKEIQ